MASAVLPSGTLPAAPPSVSRQAAFYRPELDALRLAAFLLVFVHHVLPHGAGEYPGSAMGAWWAALANAAGFGLPLFFCLSGYLIATLLVLEHERTGRVALGAFYLRRALRIGPLYLLGLGLGVAWTLAMDGGAALPMFACYAGLVGNWWFQSHAWVVNPMTLLWSISVEEQFYLVFPLLLLAAGPGRLRQIGAGLIAVSLLALFAQGQAHRDVDAAIWTSTLSHAIFLGTGVLLAGVGRGRTVRLALPPRVGLVAVAAVLVIAAAAATDFKHFGPASSGVSVAGGYALVALACAGVMVAIADWPGRFHPLLIAGGRLSFGLYVFHQLALEEARLILGDVPGAVVLGLGIAWLTAAVAQVTAEAPMRRVRARFATVRSGG